MWDSIISKTCNSWELQTEAGFPSVVLSKLFSGSAGTNWMVSSTWVIPCRNQAAQIPHVKMYVHQNFNYTVWFSEDLFLLTQRTKIFAYMFVSSSLVYRQIITWQNLTTCLEHAYYIPLSVGFVSSLSTPFPLEATAHGIPIVALTPGTLSLALRGATTPVACQKSPLP